MRRQQTLSKLLRGLWLHIAPRRRIQFGLLFFLMLIASIAEVISIGAVLPFLSIITAPESVFNHPSAAPLIRLLGISQASQLLLPLTIMFSLAALLSGAARLLLLWAQTRLSHAIGADLSFSIYRRTLYQPYSVHVARNSSEIIAGISAKANSVVNYTLLPILIILSSAMLLIAILAALVAIEPRIAFGALAGFGLIYISIIAITKKRMSRYSQRISIEQNQIFKALHEGLGGIRDVLIDGTQEAYCKIYRNADLPLRRAMANVQLIGGFPRYGVESLGMVLIAFLAYSMSHNSAGVELAVPVLGALALGAQRMLPVLQQSYAGWTNIRGNEANLSDALDLLNQELPSYVNSPPPSPIQFQSCISIKNLEFRYYPESRQILGGLDLTIAKGDRVGFIGETGSGKSTLLDIIMGLLSPSSGSLEIDGVRINMENNRAWQAHIAHVPQSIFLADVTIAENIAFGVPIEDIDLARVRSAAQKAQVALTIESWELGYNTNVGERGVRLSGGQRQRIGIARALYKQADVIVFDEATSALDSETENEVMAAIAGLGSEITILMVAHRYSTLKGCNMLVELKNRNVSRIGTYQEMIDAAN